MVTDADDDNTGHHGIITRATLTYRQCRWCHYYYNHFMALDFVRWCWWLVMTVNEMNFVSCCRLSTWNSFGNKCGWQDTHNAECSQWKRPNKVCRRSQRSNTGGLWTDVSYLVCICAYNSLAFLLCSFLVHIISTHNRFTALLEYVRDHPGEQVPER